MNTTNNFDKGSILPTHWRKVKGEVIRGQFHQDIYTQILRM